MRPTCARWVTSGKAPQRARREGKRLGRPPIAPELKERIQKALNVPGRTEGVRKIAERLGVHASTVQAISAELAGRPFEASASAAM